MAAVHEHTDNVFDSVVTREIRRTVTKREKIFPPAPMEEHDLAPRNHRLNHYIFCLIPVPSLVFSFCLISTTIGSFPCNRILDVLQIFVAIRSTQIRQIDMCIISRVAYIVTAIGEAI